MRFILTVLVTAVLFAVGNLYPAANSYAGGKTTMNIQIKGHSFTAKLEDNATALAFSSALPLHAHMQDLNHNEKYFYLSQPLPARAQSVRHIKAGDIMLFGTDCLVLFYKDFSTPYRYTPIAHIQNTAGLEELVGKGDVTVVFKP